ncbi:MAG: anti-sigma factor family protein [Gaiellaceae bacterium]
MIDAVALGCQEFVELVTAYLEGALDPADQRRFDEHLAACGNCAQYLEQIRQTIRVTGTLRPEDLSAEAEEALLKAFRSWRRS